MVKIIGQKRSTSKNSFTFGQKIDHISVSRFVLLFTSNFLYKTDNNVTPQISLQRPRMVQERPKFKIELFMTKYNIELVSSDPKNIKSYLFD